MSELEKIGQRIGERLLASGWLFSVEIEVQETSIVLKLVPRARVLLSERVLRFCVNFLGEQHRNRQQRHTLFFWCAAFVEFPTNDQTCQVWVDCEGPCGYAGFDTLTELLLLGLKLSSKLPTQRESNAYRLEDLVQVYRTREEVLDYYERFVTQIIQARDDLPTETCDASLRTRWICCLKHRFLFVQRLMLNRWLHFFCDQNPNEEDGALPEMDFLVDHPSVEMQQILAQLFKQTFSPQTWLQMLGAYAAQFEQRQWMLPTPSCNLSRHGRWLCCGSHVTLTVITRLFDLWLVSFDDLYHISSMVDAWGHTPNLSGTHGLALLIAIAKLDVRGLSLPEWFKDVRDVDISAYHPS